MGDSLGDNFLSGHEYRLSTACFQYPIVCRYKVAFEFFAKIHLHTHYILGLNLKSSLNRGANIVSKR